MKRIAKFEKVSEKQFLSDYTAENGEEIYKSIKLPKRATSGSAGYDFFVPFDVKLEAGESARIPTGLRAIIEDGWVLKIYPRSSLGVKYGLQLNNTVGIIDSDYYRAENEGHIFIMIANDSKEGKPLEIKSGGAFAQGVFVEYGITFDDCTNSVRKGGIGSTSEK